MKRILILLILCIQVINLFGCTNTPETTKEIINKQKPYEDRAPQEFTSEEDFVKAVREGKVAKAFHPEKIDCYYRPKVVPEGASLQCIKIKHSYITLIYTFNKTDKNDVTKQIKYVWYRFFDDAEEYMNNEKEERGYQIVQFEGAKSNETFLANTDFNYEKANKEESGRPNWDFLFVQDGNCFAGVVPWTFEEKDIAKYFDMEKVTIE